MCMHVYICAQNRSYMMWTSLHIYDYVCIPVLFHPAVATLPCKKTPFLERSIVTTEMPIDPASPHMIPKDQRLNCGCASSCFNHWSTRYLSPPLLWSLKKSTYSQDSMYKLHHQICTIHHGKNHRKLLVALFQQGLFGKHNELTTTTAPDRTIHGLSMDQINHQPTPGGVQSACQILKKSRLC